MDEGLSKKRGAHISGRLKNYMRWPIAMAIMLLLLNLWIYCIDIKAGTLMLIFMLIYIVGIGILYVTPYHLSADFRTATVARFSPNRSLTTPGR